MTLLSENEKLKAEIEDHEQKLAAYEQMLRDKLRTEPVRTVRECHV